MREREGPSAKRWEGEGGTVPRPSPALRLRPKGVPRASSPAVRERGLPRQPFPEPLRGRTLINRGRGGEVAEDVAGEDEEDALLGRAPAGVPAGQHRAEIGIEFRRRL